MSYNFLTHYRKLIGARDQYYLILETIVLWHLFTSSFMIAGCFSEGPRVMVETEQPESEFVIVCQWYSGGMFNLHGGMKKVKSTAYVVSSGEVVDCGVSVFGGVASVVAYHPLYAGSEGCIGSTCKKNNTFYLRNGLVVLKPESIENKLVRIQSEFSNKDIVNEKMIGALLFNRYFQEYKKVKEFNVPTMQKMFNTRLVHNLQAKRKIYENAENKISLPTSDEYLEYFWEQVNENN